MKSHSILSGALAALVFATALLAGCVAQPESPVPTVASLPTATFTPPPTQTLPPTAVSAAAVSPTATLEPSPSEAPLGDIWYANGAEDLIYVYDCRELTCGKIATYSRGDEVEVLAVDGDWALIRLADGLPAFVQAADLQETPVSTETPTATSTANVTTTTTRTPTRTPSPSATGPTPTFTWTLGAPGTPIPTLALVGPSIIGGVIGLPGGTANPDGVVLPTYPPPTSVGRQPPGVPTLTPTRTSMVIPTSTLSAPLGTSTLPPIVISTTTGSTPETPGGSPPPISTAMPTSGPPGGGPQPPTPATTPTFGPPPGVQITPPGA